MAPRAQPPPGRAATVMAILMMGACPSSNAPDLDADSPGLQPGVDLGGSRSNPPPPHLFELPELEPWRPMHRLGWPIQSVHITSNYGWRVDPVSGEGVRLHRGLDFRGATGDFVLSIGDGRVAFVGHDPSLGTMVIIDHGDGLQSLYGHMSDVLVVTDVVVQRGAAIGLVGNTGRSSAPHLHLTVTQNGRAFDPLDVLGEPRVRPGALVAPDALAAPIDRVPSAGNTETTMDDAASLIEEETQAAQLERASSPTRALHSLPQHSDDGGKP